MKIIGIDRDDRDVIVQMSWEELRTLTGCNSSNLRSGNHLDLREPFRNVPEILAAKQRLSNAAETLRGIASVLENVDVSTAAKVKE